MMFVKFLYKKTPTLKSMGVNRFGGQKRVLFLFTGKGEIFTFRVEFFNNLFVHNFKHN